MRARRWLNNRPASGWPGVCNHPKKPGQVRWVFWRGNGRPRILVRGNDLTTESFSLAYRRFVSVVLRPRL